MEQRIFEDAAEEQREAIARAPAADADRWVFLDIFDELWAAGVYVHFADDALPGGPASDFWPSRLTIEIHAPMPACEEDFGRAVVALAAAHAHFLRWKDASRPDGYDVALRSFLHGRTLGPVEMELLVGEEACAWDRAAATLRERGYLHDVAVAAAREHALAGWRARLR